jgi:hypothetical protein
MNEKLVCKICGRKCKNYKSITSHIRQTHLVSPKEYYDKYFKKNDEGLCANPLCKNKTNYSGFRDGYYNFCGQKCLNNDEERIISNKKKLKKYLQNTEVRKDISKRVKKQWKENKEYIKKMTTSGNEFRKKQGRTMSKRYEDIEERIKTSKAIKQVYIDIPELREKARQHALSMWADPSSSFYKDGYWSRVYKALTKTGPNYAEKIIIEILEKLYPGEYKYTGDFSFWIGMKNPDFLCFKKKKIIEHFGVWWHGKECTGIENSIHEKERIKHFSDYGYDCLIIWENELSNIQSIEKKISTFHKMGINK